MGIGCGQHDDDPSQQQGTSSCSGPGSCSSGGCQQQQHQQQQGSFGSWIRRHGSTNDATVAQAAGSDSTSNANSSLGTCMKCKTAPAATTVRQLEPYCHACIEAGVQQKSRVATKGFGLIDTGDKALLPLSGGAASAALLYCMSNMQAADGTRPGRGKVAYGLTALHVDCSCPADSRMGDKGASQVPGAAAAGTAASVQQGNSEQQQQQQQHWKQLHQQLHALAAAAGFVGQLSVLHLSDVFCDQQQLQQLLTQQQQGCEQQQQQQQQQQAEPGQHELHSQLQQHHGWERHMQHQQRLQELLSSVTDPTGREDLATHLRDQLLLHAAAALGCNRLLRGDCASRIAVKVIAEAAKGRGFSLPADIQFLDGREASNKGVCVLQPLREITHKELTELCTFKSIPLLQPTATSTSSSSVNALSHRFIQDMEGSLPASIYTIIRTATHLEPFRFTDAAAVVPQAAEKTAKRQHRPSKSQQQHQSEDGSTSIGVDHGLQWQFCSICRAPLPLQNAGAASTSSGDQGGSLPQSKSSSTSNRLCYSCNRQILQYVQVPAAPVDGRQQHTAVSAKARLKQLLPAGMLLQDDSDDDRDA